MLKHLSTDYHFIIDRDQFDQETVRDEIAADHPYTRLEMHSEVEAHDNARWFANFVGRPVKVSAVMSRDTPFWPGACEVNSGELDFVVKPFDAEQACIDALDRMCADLAKATSDVRSLAAAA